MKTLLGIVVVVIALGAMAMGSFLVGVQYSDAKDAEWEWNITHAPAVVDLSVMKSAEEKFDALMDEMEYPRGCDRPANLREMRLGRYEALRLLGFLHLVGGAEQWDRVERMGVYLTSNICAQPNEPALSLFQEIKGIAR